MWKTHEPQGILTTSTYTGLFNQSQAKKETNVSLREFTFSARDRLQRENRGAGVAIYSDQPHVVTKGLDLGEADDLNNSVFHLTGRDWEKSLEQFVKGLTPEDLAACAAVRYSADEPLDPWNALNLAELRDQLSGRWFDDLLLQKRLVAHYQPIYNVKSCRVAGFEALARGVDRTGIRSGFELVSAADKLGRKTEFDSLARIAALSCLNHQLQPTELLFINLSPASFEHGCDSLHSTLFAIQAADLNPNQVVFEFVEADQFPKPEALRRLIATIREFGARIALDDFGAGHSTIAIAELIKPDIIKFDRTLIQTTEDLHKEELVTSLVQFARSVAAQTVAEGVETIAQFAFAERCGFDCVQGWLIGKPHARLRRPELALQKSLID